MSRLTKKDCYGHWYTNEKINDRMQADEPYPHAYDGKPIDKLADYEDKQEQGLLIELKVPLGTKIWYLSYEEDYEQGWWDIDCGIYSLSWIHYHENKEFYLTRSEAEEALAKMGGKE